jgi:hypothetical protein
MELTTHLVQESRPTRLLVRTPYAAGPRTINGTLTLYAPVFLQSLSPSHNRWLCDFRLQPEYPARGNGLQIELIPVFFAVVISTGETACDMNTGRDRCVHRSQLTTDLGDKITHLSG